MLKDTPLAKIDEVEFVRTVAVARIVMPQSMVRLSAGRESMSEACQALCFMAGANSIFTGDKLLTAATAGDDTRSEEHTPELQSLMRTSYAAFCSETHTKQILYSHSTLPIKRK